MNEHRILVTVPHETPLGVFTTEVVYATFHPCDYQFALKLARMLQDRGLEARVEG